MSFFKLKAPWDRRRVKPLLSGKLINCPDSKHGGKVFYIENGRRHWVPSGEHLKCYGLRIENVVQVSQEEISGYIPAGPLPMIWPEPAWRNPPRTNSSVLREVATSRLRGSGIEFGPGTYPVSIPLSCEVKFADFVPEPELRKRAYQAQGSDFVPLAYVTSLEAMDGIPGESLDFVIASHVIEHVRNPLRAFERAYTRLKPGGQFVLFVPEKRATFDKDRDVTSLEHLIADYQEPSSKRDVSHYFDFFTKAFPTPEAELQKRVDEAIATDYDIHFHTWTYESFKEMADYARRKLTPWSAVWSQPAIAGDPDSIEFYFVFEK
jgi:SAM-dependent methyltransferase